MNDQKLVEMNGVLSQMRVQLEGEEAFGPDSDQQSSHTGDGKGGTLGAENENNIWDAFDFFIGNIVDNLLETFDISEDDAVDFIFTIADELAEDGKMPFIPSEDDDEKGVASWLGSAGTLGFERVVLDAAENDAQ